MNFFKLSFLFFLTLSIFSCKKPADPILSSEKELISFTIEAEFNPGLSETIEGEVTDSTIELLIPKNADIENLIISFEFIGDYILIGEELLESGSSAVNFDEPVEFTVTAEDGSTKIYTAVIEWDDGYKTYLPHIKIEIEDEKTVVEKKVYLNAFIRIDGKGKYENFKGEAKIRGRGNSTWQMPKKPYRLKLNSKASLFGLPAYKNWILLAEYLDGTMLYNSIPFKAGRMLEIPYTNHIIPVEVSINGEYQGIYAFTEHKEVGEGRIDIGEDGWLLELDVYYDEDWKFKSEKYDLPVMIQYPKDDNMNEDILTEIKDNFEEFEQLVFNNSFPDNNYLDYFDDLSYINYMIVYQLTLNIEINHPKSTYINKPAGEKFRMGIIWDFDWGYGYNPENPHYSIYTATMPLFVRDPKPGSVFFNRFMKDPHIQKLFRERWQWFRNNKYDKLKEYVSDYAEQIKPAVPNDHALWNRRGSSGDTDRDLERVLKWLDARAAYLDSYVSNFPM